MNEMTKKILPKISQNDTRELIYWHDILEHFPIKNKYKLKILTGHYSPDLSMGILVDHLMGVARAVGISNVYIREVSHLRRQYRKSKRKGDSNAINPSTLKLSLLKETKRLLEATRDKVLQLN